MNTEKEKNELNYACKHDRDFKKHKCSSEGRVAGVLKETSSLLWLSALCSNKLRDTLEMDKQVWSVRFF